MSAYYDAIIEGPAYLGDAKHVLLSVQFTGAPSAPDPANIYSGPQVIAIKTDGTQFANGDSWKCITCAIPDATRKLGNLTTHSAGQTIKAGDTWLVVDHPQAFPGDRKMLAGTNVIDCGPHRLVDDACTPDKLRVYPIRWNVMRDGSGKGGAMRELRLNPDGIHLMWSHMNGTGANLDQHGLVGRLQFNPAPKDGEPAVPRYDLVDAYVMTNSGDPTFAAFRVDPKDPARLISNPAKGAIGEARGWTRDGKDAVGMGIPEAGAVDMYITSLRTGASRRLTNAPGYADPILMSPDDKWFVVFDNRGVERHMYYAGMQGVPPLTDMLTLMVKLSDEYGYRNGQRRFFQPYLIDRWGDRGGYLGQQLNPGPGTPGSASDPNWNARADPAWSPDGTNVVYWQALVTAPACGGANPLPCPTSTEPGGRHSRLMIARLPDRKPLPLGRVARPGKITVPWGAAYKPGDPMPARMGVPEGKFTLAGRKGGSARVEIRKTGGRVAFVSASYEAFTDDGEHVIDGTESAAMEMKGGKPRIVWHSDMRSSGAQVGTKKTSEPGGFVISPMGEPLEGELVTTIDGKTYRPVQKGT
ncbi:hypothetical protein WG901_21765 [Novosphingobium sp. PS1R-30]|uniref:WD40 repeat protein n=1 Tax=Novosphingobium anseongense TaxID=3133436 RepID=A0ABU8S339_9SPHN